MTVHIEVRTTQSKYPVLSLCSHRRDIMQLFSAETTMFSKIFFFFAPENMKKTHSKVAHNRPKLFFSVLAWLPKRCKNRNPEPPKAP